MNFPEEWAKAADPAELFLLLWAVAASWLPDQRVDAQAIPADTQTRIADSLLAASAAVAVEGICSALKDAWPTAATAYREDVAAGLILGVMTEIDERFLCVHPRAALVPTSIAPRPATPAWLKELRDRRTVSGSYASNSEARLVPRGPFGRGARVPSDVNADTLADRFSALSAVPARSALDESPVDLEVCVVGQDALNGVPPNPRGAGSEVVAVVPIAEIGTDLLGSTFTRSDSMFLDVGIGATLTPGARLSSAINVMSGVDLLVAPELTMPETEIAVVQSALGGRAAPRLTIAGSGASVERDEKGRSWNQAIALNGFGVELWRHQKVWPFEMGQDRAKECSLGDPGSGRTLKENIASGRKVTVADIDGLGRVVVFICQDIQMEPVVSQVLRVYQPDWVVVPIMDPGIQKSRWIHSRTYDLSATSRARFIVVSSLAMAEWANMKDPHEIPIGLLLGPRGTTRTDPATTISRAVALLKCQEATPMRARAQWNVPAPYWEQTTIDTVSFKP